MFQTEKKRSTNALHGHSLMKQQYIHLHAPDALHDNPTTTKTTIVIIIIIIIMTISCLSLLTTTLFLASGWMAMQQIKVVLYELAPDHHRRDRTAPSMDTTTKPAGLSWSSSRSSSSNSRSSSSNSRKTRTMMSSSLPPNDTTTTTTTTTTKHDDLTFPRNINIAFLGDSVTRYAYISLAYFLRTGGTWPTPSRHQCTTAFAKHCPWLPGHPGDNWYTYYQMTNALLGGWDDDDDDDDEAATPAAAPAHPVEVCDCFRGRYDARYFYDPRYHNRLSFFMRTGHEKDAPFRGRLSSATVWQQMANHSLSGIPWAYSSGPDHTPLWEHADWAEMIQQELGRMNPKPEYVVMNAGVWENRFHEPEIRLHVSKALQDIGVKQAFWRTTTFESPRFHTGGHQTAIRRKNVITDHSMCRVLGGCINVSFTARAHRDFFADMVHFHEPVYRLMNEELLAVLGKLPTGYQRLDPMVISKSFDEVVKLDLT